MSANIAMYLSLALCLIALGGCFLEWIYRRGRRNGLAEAGQELKKELEEKELQRKKEFARKVVHTWS